MNNQVCVCSRFLLFTFSLSPPSASEIKEILNLAKLHELEVIPLVQTFGHMEVSECLDSGDAV